jgi:hypothetical protein
LFLASTSSGVGAVDGIRETYVLGLQLALELLFALVQSAELVDLFLVFTADLDLVAVALFLLAELETTKSQQPYGRGAVAAATAGPGSLTMRRFMLKAWGVCASQFGCAGYGCNGLATRQDIVGVALEGLLEATAWNCRSESLADEA